MCIVLCPKDTLPFLTQLVCIPHNGRCFTHWDLHLKKALNFTYRWYRAYVSGRFHNLKIYTICYFMCYLLLIFLLISSHCSRSKYFIYSSGPLWRNTSWRNLELCFKQRMKGKHCADILTWTNWFVSQFYISFVSLLYTAAKIFSSNQTVFFLIESITSVKIKTLEQCLKKS